MKFIPGAKFSNSTMKNTKLFKPGVLYILKNINKTEEGYTYTFTVNGESKDIKFNSVQQADEWLNTIIF